MSLALAGAAAAQAAAPTGPEGDKAKAIVYVLVAVTVIVLIFVVLKKVGNIFDNIGGAAGSFLEKIGLKETEEERKRKAEAEEAAKRATQNDSPFNPKLYKTAPAGTKIVTKATAEKLAKQIWDSVGAIYDDPEAGFAAIKQCTNWATVSWLSDVFNEKYGRDLYEWMKIKYDRNSQVEILTKIVNYAFSLPKY